MQLSKCSRKEQEEKTKKKTVLLGTRRLNSIEIIISKALIDFDISHKEFRLAINEEQIYIRLKVNIMKKSQRYLVKSYLHWKKIEW